MLGLCLFIVLNGWWKKPQPSKRWSSVKYKWDPQTQSSHQPSTRTRFLVRTSRQMSHNSWLIILPYNHSLLPSDMGNCGYITRGADGSMARHTWCSLNFTSFGNLEAKPKKIVLLWHLWAPLKDLNCCIFISVGAGLVWSKVVDQTVLYSTYLTT